MNPKFDLDTIKNEILSRKAQDDKILEENGTPRMAKNEFISKLLSAQKTGQPNEVSEKIRSVSIISENMDVDPVTGRGVLKPGVKTEQLLSKPTRQTQQAQRSDINENLYNQPSIDPSGERDNRLYAEMERRAKEYSKQGMNLDKYIQPTTGNQYPNPNYGQQGSFNPDVTEKFIIDVIEKYLENKMVPLVKELLKNAIVDQYTNNVVKNNISQSKDIVKELLKEIIRENKK